MCTTLTLCRIDWRCLFNCKHSLTPRFIVPRISASFIQHVQILQYYNMYICICMYIYIYISRLVVPGIPASFIQHVQTHSVILVEAETEMCLKEFLHDSFKMFRNCIITYMHICIHAYMHICKYIYIYIYIYT